MEAAALRVFSMLFHYDHVVVDVRLSYLLHTNTHTSEVFTPHGSGGAGAPSNSIDLSNWNFMSSSIGQSDSDLCNVASDITLAST
jgi:hypothetical protein